MRRLLVAAGLLLGVLAFAGPAYADEVFRAKLTGDQEVPAVGTDTSGMAIIHVDVPRTSAEFKLFVKQGQRVTQAHIHCAPRGANGPIVVFLAGFHDRGWDVDGKWVTATFTQVNVVNPACGGTLSDLVDNMRAGNTYVNVHTVARPGGEIRGQVVAAGR